MISLENKHQNSDVFLFCVTLLKEPLQLLHRTTDLINRIEWLFLYETIPRFEVSVSFYRKQVRPEIEQVYAGHYSTGTALPSNKWGEGWKKAEELGS